MSTKSSEYTRVVRIGNELGLHLRAAGVLVQAAGNFKSDIWLKRGASDANAKSIMSVLTLAASKGVELEVIARGDDAADAVNSIAKLLETGLNER